MYNRINLPLESRKIIKKSFGTIVNSTISLIALLIISVMTSAQNIYAEIGPTIALNTVVNSLIGLVIITMLATVFYQYLYFKLYYYNFNEENGEIKKGVIAQATGHVYYNRIQNIYVDQDILDRIFGLYDVHYETAGDSSNFYSHVDGLNKTNADLLIKFLVERTKNKPTEQSQVNESVPAEINKEENSMSVISKATMPISGRYAFSLAISITMIMFVFTLFVASSLIEKVPLVNSLVFGSILAFILGYLYALAWVKFFDFSFDQEKSTISSGVISRQTQIIYYNRIQNININQGLLDRILGIYSITVETAAAGEQSTNRTQVKQIPSIVGLTKKDAETLKNFLIEKTKIYRANI